MTCFDPYCVDYAPTVTRNSVSITDNNIRVDKNDEVRILFVVCCWILIV